jgi:hypothetical protein
VGNCLDYESRRNHLLDKEALSCKPLFIVGCDRSGTTLLSIILETKFNMVAPLEPHFIPYFSRVLFLWGDLSNPNNRIDLMSAIDDFLMIWTPINNRQRDPKKVKSATLLAIRDQFPAIAKECRSFSELIEEIFYRYARLNDKFRWVDNSSFYDVTPLKLWERHLPDLKVIHIIRDGRDVALSWMRSWFHPVNFVDAARRWAAHVKEKRRWGASHPKQYLEIRYEDLLLRSEDVITKIGNFLKLSPIAGPFDLKASNTARILSTGGTHDLLATNKILKSNLEKWKQYMSEDNQKLFEYISGDQLAKCGYERRYLNFSFQQKIRLFLKTTISCMQNIFFRRYYLNKLKAFLPVAIFLSQRMGISFAKLLKMKTISNLYRI